MQKAVIRFQRLSWTDRRYCPHYIKDKNTISDIPVICDSIEELKESIKDRAINNADSGYVVLYGRAINIQWILDRKIDENGNYHYELNKLFEVLTLKDWFKKYVIFDKRKRYNKNRSNE